MTPNKANEELQVKAMIEVLKDPRNFNCKKFGARSLLSLFSQSDTNLQNHSGLTVENASDIKDVAEYAILVEKNLKHNSFRQ
jgi:hypothetical protein